MGSSRSTSAVCPTSGRDGRRVRYRPCSARRRRSGASEGQRSAGGNLRDDCRRCCRAGDGVDSFPERIGYMSASPTARTLAKLRADGWLAWVVEKWIPQTRKRSDLFGFIDILALRDGEVLAVQATSRSNVRDRKSTRLNSSH